jgi:hypothetical protein
MSDPIAHAMDQRWIDRFPIAHGDTDATHCGKCTIRQKGLVRHIFAQRRRWLGK